MLQEGVGLIYTALELEAMQMISAFQLLVVQRALKLPDIF